MDPLPITTTTNNAIPTTTNNQKSSSSSISSSSLSSSNARPLLYQPEIQQMMFVFGEYPEAIDEVTILVEQIVQRHTMEMIVNSYSIAKLRGAKTIAVDDIVFLVRFDKSRVNRLKDYLGWKDVRKSAKSEDKDELDVADDDAADASAASKKRVKFGYEYLKEFTDFLETEINEDDEEDLMAYRDTMLRLKADDEATLKMTQAEYMFYSECKAASFTHRKNKRFRDWAQTDTLGGGKATDDVIDVVGFLCYEMVREITETALIVRRQTTECQQVNTGHHSQSTNPHHVSPLPIVPLHNSGSSTTTTIKNVPLKVDQHVPSTDSEVTPGTKAQYNNKKYEKSIASALAKAKAAEKNAEEKDLAAKEAELFASTSPRKGRKLAKTKAAKALQEAQKAAKEATRLRDLANALNQTISPLDTKLIHSGKLSDMPLSATSPSSQAPLKRLTGNKSQYKPDCMQVPPTFATPQWRNARVTPLSNIELSLPISSETPLHSMFTMQWYQSQPSSDPFIPENGLIQDQAVEDMHDLGNPMGSRQNALIGPTPSSRKGPLTAKHIEEAYRRLMTARCHTRIGGTNINARPRRL